MRTRTLSKITAALALAGAITLPSTANASGAAVLAAILQQAIAQITQMQTIDGSINEQAEQTQQEIENQSEQTQTTIEETSVDQQNNERTLYNEQVRREQQPMPFCPEDQKVSGQISRAKTQAAYSASVDNFNHFNASEHVRVPARFEKAKNDALKNMVEKVQNGESNCDPRIAPPINKTDIETNNGTMQCSPEEIDMFVKLVGGRKPVPQPPEALKNTATGQFLVSEADNYNARQSIIDQALLGTAVEEVDLLLQAYQKLSESPDVETINKMTATGGVERVKWFQQQIETQLQIQIYKELMQSNRLMAVITAQRQEEHLRDINKLVQSLTTR